VTDDLRRDQPHDSRENHPAPEYQDIDQREPTNRGRAVHVEQAGGTPQRGSEPAAHPGNQRGPAHGQPPAQGRSQGKPGKPAQHRDDRDNHDNDDGH
jgi:hypothetical protein